MNYAELRILDTPKLIWKISQQLTSLENKDQKNIMRCASLFFLYSIIGRIYIVLTQQTN